MMLIMMIIIMNFLEMMMMRRRRLLNAASDQTSLLQKPTSANVYYCPTCAALGEAEPTVGRSSFVRFFDFERKPSFQHLTGF
jgi:hypothetical protein